MGSWFRPDISFSRGLTGTIAEAVALQVVADEVAGAQYVRRQPHDRDGARRPQDFADARGSWYRARSLPVMLSTPATC